MRYKDRFTKGCLVCFILACLPPFALLLLGGLYLLSGAIINATFIISFIILPLAYSAGCYFLILGKLKVYWKIILYIPILASFLFIFAAIFIFGYHEKITCYKDQEALEAYGEESQYSSVMPVESSIGNPTGVEYYDYYSLLFPFFTCDAGTLICQYDADSYSKQKSMLDETYIFQKEAVICDGKTYEATAEIDSYTFRMLSVEGEYEYEIYYPNEMFLIATNDATREIVYISFYDQYLNYIDSLADYINEYCGWEHIR